MSQRTRVILGILVVLAIAGAVFWIRSGSAAPSDRLVVAGDVRSDIRTINAPVITYPTPDYTVGITATGSATGAASSGKSLAGAALPAGGSSSAAKRRVAPSASSGRAPVVAGMLTAVTVREGDSVKAGDVVARFDTKLLKSGVAAAKADAARSKANVRLMSAALNTLSDAKANLVTARAKAFSTAFAAINAGLAKATAPIIAQHAAAVKGRPQLVAGIAQLKATLAVLPPTSPQVPVLKAQLAKLTITLAQVDAFLKQWPTIKKTFAKAKVSAQAKAGSAINTQINSAKTKIRKAEKDIKNTRAVLRIVSENSHIGVDLAKTKVTLATIRTPVGGVVTFARRAGTVALVGAPLVRVRTDGPRLIDTYLTAEQVAVVPVGSAADVTFDSAPGTVLHGTVSTIGSAYLYPPTSFPTSVVHMTRTLKATITVDQGSSLPEGTPVDISIKTTAKK